MYFLQLINLFSWSVACSSIIQGQYHVFITNVTTTPTNSSSSTNASINANVSSSANTEANIPFQNLTDLNPFKSRAASVQNLQSFNGALAGVQAPPILMSSDKGRPFLVQGDTFPDFATAGGRTCETQYTGCSSAANAKNMMEEPGPKGGKDGRSGKGQGKGPKDGNNRARIRAIGSPKNNTSAGVPKENAKADTATAPDTNEKAGPTKPGTGVSIADCDAQKTSCIAAQKNAPFQSFNLENVGPDPEMPEFDLLCAP